MAARPRPLDHDLRAAHGGPPHASVEITARVARMAEANRPAPTAAGVEVEVACVRRPGRWSWAALLRRVFAVDILVCPRCTGPRRILGTVTEPHAMRRLLATLGLAAESPPRPGVGVTAAS